MLVLHRKAGQCLILDGPELKQPITITISEILPSRVKLGIQAPLSVNVVRKELFEKAEQGEKPDTWFTADRESARYSAGPLTKEYIAALEQIARLADVFWTTMAPKTRTPEQHQISDELLDALATVNFLAEKDSLEDEEAHTIAALA